MITSSQFDNYVYVKLITQKKTFCLIVLDAEKTLRDNVLTLANEKGIQLAAHYTRFYDVKSLLLSKKDESLTDESIEESLRQLESLSKNQYELVLSMSEVIRSKLLPQQKTTSSSKVCKPLSASSKPWHFPSTSTAFDNHSNTQLTSNTNPRNVPKSNFPRPYREHYSQSLTVVRLRGLPWTATEEDIIKFFTNPPSPAQSPASPTEDKAAEEKETTSESSTTNSSPYMKGLPKPKTVLILLNLHGRSTGEAYVEFPLTSDDDDDEDQEKRITPAQKALNYWQGKHMGRRYIEIFPASPSELQNAEQMLTMSPMMMTPAISNMNPIVPQMGPPGMMMPITQQIMAHDLDRSTVVRIRGMPFNTSIEEIVQFFYPLLEDYVPNNQQIGLSNIVIISNNVNGSFRPTGEAYVKFSDANKAREATSKKYQNMNNRYVEVFKVTEQEMLIYLTSIFSPVALTLPPPPMCAPAPFFLSPQEMPPYIMAPFPFPQRPPARRPRSNGNSSHHHFQQHLNFSEHVVRVRGLPFECDEGDIAEFFHGINIASQGIHLILNESNEKSTGEALVEFNSEADVQMALQRHRQMIGKRYIEVFRSNSGQHNYQSPSEHQTENVDEERGDNGGQKKFRSTNANGQPKARRTPRQNSDRIFFNGKLIASLSPQLGMDGMMLLPIDNMAAHHHNNKHHRRQQYYEYTSSTVRMRGLPFSSSVEDIIEFFSGYEIDPNSIQLRSDGSGRKNGEAFVNFSSAEEAKRAVEDRNRFHMGTRYIELFLLGTRHNEGDKSGETISRSNTGEIEPEA